MSEVLIDKLNQNTDNAYSYLKLESCNVYRYAKRVVYTFLIPADVYDRVCSDKQYGSRLKDRLAELTPKPFSVEIVLKKSFADEELVTNSIYNFVRDNYISIAGQIKKSSITVTRGDNGTYTITVYIPEQMRSFIEAREFDSDLLQYLQRSYCEDNFGIQLIYVEDGDKGAPDAADEEEEEIYVPKIVKVSDVTAWIGKDIGRMPSRIENSNREDENIVLCGKIGSISRHISKTGEKVFYTFMITDPTGMMHCIYFPRKKDAVRFESVTDGKEVLVSGAVRPDNRSGGYKFWMYDLSFCVIDWQSGQDMSYKPVPKSYRAVYPQAYEELYQDNFLDRSAETPVFLLNKTFVVFDTETTGLDTSSCEIIELAGVKIVDGKIKETFSTFVYPTGCETGTPGDRHLRLPAEIKDITGIDESDLEEAPLPEVVMADFYKFTRGAALVAHNASYDMPILLRVGKNAEYKFDNDVYDTLALAKKYMPSSGKFNLESLCNRLGIELTGAHRAVNDALATAKVFIRLAEYM